MTRAHPLPILPALLFVLVALLSGQSASAQASKHPFLWRIEGKGGQKAQSVSYLFGTMHLGDARLVNLPDVVDKAVDETDAVYCELALDETMKQQVKLTKMMTLPRGQSLKKLLPPDLYEKLDSRLRKLGSSARQFNRFQPWAVSIIIAQLEAARLGMTKSLDMELYMGAKREDKEVGGLESVTEQMEAIGGGRLEDHLISLRESLDYMDELDAKGSSSLGSLLEAYLTGDETKILDVVEAAMGKNDDVNERLMKPMLDERNIRMANRIAEKLTGNPTKKYFFAIGAMHYIGESSILRLLRKKGYRMTRIQPPAANWESHVAMREEVSILRARVRKLARELEAAKK